MRIERYDDSRRSLWDAFVETSINGTLAHSRHFLSYHPADRFNDHSLLIWDDRTRLAAVIPAAEVNANGQRIMHSHPGATYGGFVVDERSNMERSRAIVAAVTDYAGSVGFNGIRMRTPERIFHRCCCEELDVAQFQAGFTVEGRELSCAVNCYRQSPETLLAQYKVNTRNAIHKSRRAGVTAERSSAIADFWSILAQNLLASHKVRPTHSLDELLRLQQLLGERMVFVGGFWRGTLISGCVLFVMNDRATHTMYMAQNYDHQQLRSLNLVMHTAINLCASRGSHYVNFGISSVPGTLGVQMNYGLEAFKRSFAGEGVLRDLWYKPL